MNTELETDITTLLGKPYNVILFNDDHTPMVLVASQIVKAIHCSTDRAVALMLEAHEKGRAIIFTGSKERAEHVEAILSEICVGTKIEPA